MAITTNLTIPATQEKTADKYWLSSLTIKSTQVQGRVEAFATLIPYNSVTADSYPEYTLTLLIDDVLTRAAQEPSLANCMEVLLNEISNQCKKNGSIL